MELDRLCDAKFGECTKHKSAWLFGDYFYQQCLLDFNQSFERTCPIHTKVNTLLETYLPRHGVSKICFEYLFSKVMFVYHPKKKKRGSCDESNGFFWKGEFTHGCINHVGSLMVWPTAAGGKLLGYHEKGRMVSVFRAKTACQTQSEITIDSTFAPCLNLQRSGYDSVFDTCLYGHECPENGSDFLKKSTLSLKYYKTLKGKLIIPNIPQSSIVTKKIVDNHQEQVLYQIHHASAMTDEVQHAISMYRKLQDPKNKLSKF